MKRREFLVMGTTLTLAASLPRFVMAGAANYPIKATAITQVFGDGVQLVAIGLEFEQAVEKDHFSAKDFTVKGRTVERVFVSQAADLVEAENGKFLIVALSPADSNTSLQEDVIAPDAPKQENKIKNGKPNWEAGQKMSKTIRFKEATASISVDGKSLETTAVNNLIVDEFKQATFLDSETGKTLKYNFFEPQNKNEPLPLVLFMHDAGVTSEQDRATLFQGLGAVIWAEPQEQAKRPCYVLAPQYDEIIADDDWRTSKYLETTIHLIQQLLKEHKIDPNRLYVTGQSGGCMTATAMNIKYPDFFAASYLVAGKWGADLVAPMAKNKIWFMASEDDIGAFPSFNGITETLEKLGTKVSRAVWNGTWNADQYRFAYDDIMAKKSQINYTVFVKDSVFRETDSRAGASGHRNTWRIAYSIEPIREWLFAQHK